MKKHHDNYKERLVRYAKPHPSKFHPGQCKHYPRCVIEPTLGQVYTSWLDVQGAWRITMGRHTFYANADVFTPLTPLEVLAEAAHG